ncbi:Metal transporter, ZIP family [Indibacter alkaliphilus LW1]|jgi:ZIP family zinc transporter|uniref:Metal transporter, ZIP family n=1 Tax=Indibacter alkaliphilus (strain CCUG 57479 / KCTC 22604 / LW1) TaxID=1189612 RepID=S2DZI3_INDAL|nr:ZIP family metal transporter [Indibacter alkaliphilus]EOZ95228.1 Metal transporter, ZIP family [Indibacter alkaliphilus LW1]
MIESIEVWAYEQGPVKSALVATIFTWLMTAMGASIVFFFKTIRRSVFDTMLGFTGGVMIAASFWSLLTPALEYAKEIHPGLHWAPVAGGFLLGGLFIFLLDRLLPHLHINFSKSESEGIPTNWHKSTLLLLAITLHNIPEGLAIGMLFGTAALNLDQATLTAAIALTIGIGIQNLPEGMAVAMPLRRNGASRTKSFMFGQLSAMVEPIAGVVGALAVVYMKNILPYALAFSAGAMIYVVVEEVIPETQRDKYTDLAVLGFMLGFTIMMILDVGIG